MDTRLHGNGCSRLRLRDHSARGPWTEQIKGALLHRSHTVHSQPSVSALWRGMTMNTFLFISVRIKLQSCFDTHIIRNRDAEVNRFRHLLEPQSRVIQSIAGITTYRIPATQLCERNDRRAPPTRSLEPPSQRGEVLSRQGINRRCRIPRHTPPCLPGAPRNPGALWW